VYRLLQYRAALRVVQTETSKPVSLF